MNKISKICGIFAVATMMLSTFFVTSCNSEDDFDFGPDSQYSLAERKMTRAGENANTTLFSNVKDSMICNFDATLSNTKHSFNANFNVRFFKSNEGKISVELIDYSRTPPLASVDGVSLTPYQGGAYQLAVNGQCGCGITCYGIVAGVVFY